MENINVESEEDFFSAEEFSNQDGLTNVMGGPDQPSSPFWFLADTWFPDLDVIDDVSQQHLDNKDGQDQHEPSDLQQDPGLDEQSEILRVKKTNDIQYAATNDSFWSVYPDAIIMHTKLQQSETSNQRLKKLMKLFPQIDPGFLNFKVNEFKDEKEMREWIGWAKRFFRRSGGGDGDSQSQNYQNDEEFKNNDMKKNPNIYGLKHRPDSPNETVDLNLIDFENPVDENCDYAEEAICQNYDIQDNNIGANDEKHKSGVNIMDLPIPDLFPNKLSSFGDNIEKIINKIKILAQGPAAAEAIEANNPLEYCQEEERYWHYIYRQLESMGYTKESVQGEHPEVLDILSKIGMNSHRLKLEQQKNNHSGRKVPIKNRHNSTTSTFPEKTKSYPAANMPSSNQEGFNFGAFAATPPNFSFGSKESSTKQAFGVPNFGEDPQREKQNKHNSTMTMPTFMGKTEPIAANLPAAPSQGGFNFGAFAASLDDVSKRDYSFGSIASAKPPYFGANPMDANKSFFAFGNEHGSSDGLKNSDNDENFTNERLTRLKSIFPQINPEFLSAKANDFEDENQMMEWVNETLENNWKTSLEKNFPTIENDEEREQKTEMLSKLVTFFPQIDPEFLKVKVLGFSDEVQMNEWVDDILENNSVNDLPKWCTTNDTAQILRETETERKRQSELLEQQQKLEAKRRQNERFFENLISLFPQIDPDFFRDISEGFDNEEDMNEWIVEAWNNDRVQTFPTLPDYQEKLQEEELFRKLEKLQSFFPQVDPEFLEEKAKEFEDEDQMNEWINENCGIDHKFPTRNDYEERQRKNEMLEKYSGDLSIEEIFEMFDGDPETYFLDKNREVSDLYLQHSWNQLKKQFRFIPGSEITKIFKSNKGLFIPCIRELKVQEPKISKRWFKRPLKECQAPTEIDFNFLKELQYFQKEPEISRFLEEKSSSLARKIDEARRNGFLMECGCCFDDECLVENMVQCVSGHKFCKECVQRASEVAIGNGQTSLTCLGKCKERFALSNLQKALKANTFSKWIKRIQVAEIENAIEGIKLEIEQCPYCTFATIMDTKPEENKLFKCKNPECAKESCRLCKQISHIPNPCPKIETDEEVQKRISMENQLSHALIRKCWKCSKSFIKEEGCNKMTCVCGAKMCYLCKKPVGDDYSHFYGQGGSPGPTNKCYLWED